MVKEVKEFNRVASERDKLFQKIQSQEISKARKELNRKISGNSARDKLKAKKLLPNKNQKHKSEWLKRELHKKRVEDSKNLKIKIREDAEKGKEAEMKKFEEEKHNEEIKREKIQEMKRKKIGEPIRKRLELGKKKNEGHRKQLLWEKWRKEEKLKQIKLEPEKKKKHQFEMQKVNERREFLERESNEEIKRKKEEPLTEKESKPSKPGFFQKTVSELRSSLDFSKKEEGEKVPEKNFFEEKKIGEPKQKKILKIPESGESKEEESQENLGKTRKEEFSKPQETLDPNVHYLKEVLEMRKEVAKVVVGQDKLVMDILRAIFADGHVLIEGVPGVAKTLLIRAIAESVGCKSSRVQFTVDLLPTDITGITTYTPNKGFETIKGPIFTNFIIADEINRAPPKTQSALLEAMQERQVTIGKETFKLDPPFFVMANNNPIENSGTYKLPEAQMDRFLFKLNMGYPTPEQEQKIIDTNITLHKFEDFKIKKIFSSQKIFELQKKTKELQASPQIKKYIVDLVQATRKPKEYDLKLGKYIEWGGSPRASIALYIGAKADATMRGQNSITPQNVKNVAHIALRHRILLNYSGQAENINTDHIIDEVLSKVQVP